MPRIFDNIDLPLLPALKETLQVSERADFCVGYFNLRGWKLLDTLIEQWAGGEGACCRLLVGMQSAPQEEFRAAYSLSDSEELIDQGTVVRLRKKVAEQFKEQLEFGAPTNADDAGLRRLSAQLRARKVIVKLFLRHRLHAKLYLLHRRDPNNPTIGFVGSSNLTMSGLAKQGELNMDVLDHDACQKLQKWFEDRWIDSRCIDISAELAEIIDNSWVRERLPYHIYLKIAYHLSQEARAGLSEFRIPRDFGNRLFEFQTAAVKIAAHHLNKRGGVLIGDVVGLGKTLMATALARIFEDDQGVSTLIICPKNLVKMWQGYVDRYGMRAKVMSASRVIKELSNVPARYRLVLIDESHNLRNREGQRYRAIQEYIKLSDSRCILLSATPYNKTYLDLSAQLRLFVPEDLDLGIRPEKQIAEMGELEFLQQYQCPVRSLRAFEKSEHADDWRDLMRLYLVRRTRSFIQANYAQRDGADGRPFLIYEDGSRSYFPTRTPVTIKFAVNDEDPDDPYARLSSFPVVRAIDKLSLPRYGLGNYVAATPPELPTAIEIKLLGGLSRAGKRLMGFCRTNLFKRLESGGPAFLQSLERHILRNFIFLHAIESGLPIPIGPQTAELLDTRTSDGDADAQLAGGLFDDEDDIDTDEESNTEAEELKDSPLTEADYRERAAQVYDLYAAQYRRRFKWVRPNLFREQLRDDLRTDARALIKVLQTCGAWQTNRDAKLSALIQLLQVTHPHDKVLVFTQFADTVDYLARQLKAHGITHVEGVTGSSPDPTELAWRFSPESNGQRDQVSSEQELRVLVATDVLSEGQNLQDCAIVVNYDLPWAIIRLIQRAGRVDRIGQQAAEILCYSFLPADGVERIIRLRSRVAQRLRENAEVVGADEAFFEDEMNTSALVNLYHEKADILDGEADAEVDLASYAYQIWKNAIDRDPSLQRKIDELPNVVYSTRAHHPTPDKPEGVLVYMRTADDTDSLAWIDRDGASVTQSQLAILNAAECAPDEPPLPRHAQHHELVKRGVEHIVKEQASAGGQLGRPSSARFRAYERLKAYETSIKGTLFENRKLSLAIQELYDYPLKQIAVDTLNRQLKSGINDPTLAELVMALREDDRLCMTNDKEAEWREPQIICSLGLFQNVSTGSVSDRVAQG
ncbi:MAG: NgoFVII family restriction endonuclease [Pyrinomonadaceae bacterium]|nr:NgoFVII family restriction endonuclease [Pyrinomonadaceae bacterium]